MNQGEYEALMADETKRVDGDISWAEDEDHSPALHFRAEIASEAGYPLFAKGYLNRASRKLTYSLIHRQSGRIYALDLGREHKNPDGERVGEKHKHRWSEGIVGVKEAYVPDDVTATANQPVEAWSQFCSEARIRHNDVMHEPPAQQLDSLL